MTDPWAVRLMKAEDAEAVARMMASLAMHHGDQPAVHAADFATYCLGDKKLAMIWVAINGSDPSGFATSYDWMNFVRGYPVRHIDLLFVKDQDRRKGVARLLIQAIARDAKSFGCQRATIGAQAQNMAANTLYQKLGFIPRTDTSPRYTLSDAAFDHLTAP